MADAAIQPVVSAAAAVVKDVKAFSRDHRARHESYVKDIDAVLDRIKPFEQNDELTYDELDTLHELRKGSKTALHDYLDAIDEHADASWWRPIRKIEKRKQVKRMERKVRKSRQVLRDYQDAVSSGGSDASSIYAESGSPPESAASQESRCKVGSWLPGTSTAESVSGMDSAFLYAHPADSLDDSPSSPSLVHPISSSSLVERSLRTRADFSPYGPRKKRTRTLTTPHQSAVLHELLAQTRFPTTAMREEVGRSIGLSARKVQIWFQNQRQRQRRTTASPSLASSCPPQHTQFPRSAGQPDPFATGASGGTLGQTHTTTYHGHSYDNGRSLRMTGHPSYSSYTSGSVESPSRLCGPGF